MRLFHRTRHFDPIAEFGIRRVMQCYPGWKQEDVVALDAEMARLDETVYEYEPFTQFKHRPLRGKYLNIDAGGFRPVANPASWPVRGEVFNVFLFGGSTTFGVGVRDSETIPAYLQNEMAAHCATPAAVYNFGRLGYFSTQEALLFYRLLSAGTVPRVAIFLDGINDFHAAAGEPDLTAELQSLLTSEQRGTGSLRDLPMWRAATLLRQWMASSAPPRTSTDFEDPRFPSRVAARLRMTEGMIGSLGTQFRVDPVFVLQPVPVYKYDLRYHFLNGLDYRKYFRYADGAKAGYPAVARMRGEFESGGNFLWLADMQEGRTENLYLSDGLHYTAAFNREIAAAIYRFMAAKGLLAAAQCQTSASLQ
jgi:lysophospholipase L1-like esterase